MALMRIPTPSASDAWRLTRTVEEYGVRILKAALQVIEQRAPAAPVRIALDAGGPRHGHPQELDAQLDSLLARSVGQSTMSSRRELHESLLRQLVPDEARILAALSDGGAAAVVHVVPRSRRPGATAPLVENVSSVGRTAGVALTEMVPTYVTHLLQLGLLELGPESAALEDDYELVMTEPVVRHALAQSNGKGVLPPRVVRQSLRLSELGRALWADCRPVDRRTG
jgi:hypothetical protein